MTAFDGPHWTKDQIQAYWSWYSKQYKGDSTANQVLRLTRGFVGPRVLDVGAATGELMRLIPGAIGIDLVPKSQDVRQGDIECLEFAAGSFDTVFACDVLEHLGDETLERGLREIWRVLAPGGTFIFGAPNNEPAYDNLVYCPHCRKGFHRHGHLRTLNPHTSRTLLELHGFNFVKSIVTDLTLRQRRYGPLRVALLRLMRIHLQDLLVIARKPFGTG